MLPFIAFFIYELTKEKWIAVSVIVAAIALLLPSPTSQWSLSAAYYWQWAEGQSKVLETFLLLLSFYLGKAGRPAASGVFLALGAFDPRFALVSLPLFVMYNRMSLTRAVSAGFAAFVVSNAALLYPPLGSSFLGMVFNTGLTTPIYYYALIPLLTVIALTLANLREVRNAFRVNPYKVREAARLPLS
jgi:hypothetical protein